MMSLDEGPDFQGPETKKAADQIARKLRNMVRRLCPEGSSLSPISDQNNYIAALVDFMRRQVV